MWGSPYVQLPKFNIDVSSLQAADNIYLTNTHWEFTLLKQKMKNMFNLGDAKFGPLEISLFTHSSVKSIFAIIKGIKGSSST